MDEFNLAEVFPVFLRDPTELFDDGSQYFSETLDQITDRLATSYEAVTDPDVSNGLMLLLHNFDKLDQRSKDSLQYLLTSGIKALEQEVKSSAGTSDGQYFIGLRSLAERYMFLLHWLLISIESTLSQSQSVETTATGRARARVPESVASAIPSLLGIFESIKSLLPIVSRLFATPAELDLFSSLYLRPVARFMENESLMKTATVKGNLFELLGLAVKLYQQQASVHTTVSQLLTYYEHMGEPLAELLALLYTKYDHTNLTQEILQDIGTRQFDGNADAKGPKLVSVFLIKLSSLVPNLVLKQLPSLVSLLDCEAFTLRCAIIDVAGAIILDLCRDSDLLQQQRSRVESLLDLVQERCLDVNPFCRSHSLQVLANVCALDEKFTKRRSQMTQAALQALSDKSMTVRRNGMKLLSVLISTHPFGLLYGTQLSLKAWNKRLSAIDTKIQHALKQAASEAAANSAQQTASTQADAENDDANKAQNESVDNDLENEESDSMDVDIDNDNDIQGEDDGNTPARPSSLPNISPETAEHISKLQLTRQYYLDAILFIERVHMALEYVENLLFSKNKAEVMDSMDLFVLVDAYGIDVAQSGIRKMLHLIWAKANNDEGQAIQKHLLECYDQLFFEAPPDMNERDGSTLVARNLINLTIDASVSELASLEKLMLLAMEKRPELVSPSLVRTLWKVYGHTKGNVGTVQRCGAAIIIGMLARGDKKIVTSNINTLLTVGLADEGLKDFALAKYTCIALQRAVPEDEWKTASANNLGPARLPVTHELVERLGTILVTPYEEMEWFGLAEQAIRAINNLCEDPCDVFSEVIRYKTRAVFESGEDETGVSQDSSFSQLLFICGEVALKSLVHLERCEALFKRARLDLEKKRSDSSTNGPADDLEAAGATNEDDFTEAISRVRENELLFGPTSLLTQFGNIVSSLCQEAVAGRKFHPSLANSMVLCLAKFMCVSGQYCEANLDILVSLMDQSDNPIIRSNCVIALGDIAVCFNYILDRDNNTNALYQRLHDKLPSVQRTCLMTLTFLILAGQVKVKGQLGELAKCIESQDKKISDQARMFFSELSTKEGAIYNGFIDMFSMLSADTTLKDDVLHRILKFLLTFIDKDKQVKQLSDKLFSRLTKADSEKQWQDLAFVLSTLPHKNEEIVAAIQQGFKHVVKVD